MTASLKKSSTFSIEEESYEDISLKRGSLKRWITGLWPFAKIKQLRHVKGHLENDQRRVVFRPDASDLEAGLTAIQRAPSTGNIRDTTFTRFLSSVFGDHEATEHQKPSSDKLLLKCQKWYLSFIDRRIEATKISLFQPVLGALREDLHQNTSFYEHTISKKRRAYRLLICVAEALKSREKKGLALTDILTVLQDPSQQEHLSKGDEEYQFLAIQLVFSIIGWLTMLYEPVPNPERNKLQLQRPTTSQRQRNLRTDIIHDFSLDTSIPRQAASITQYPLHRLLQRFGAVIPCPDPTYDNRELGLDNDMQGLSYWRGDSAVDPAFLGHNVCFHTLKKIVEVRIEWVDSLNLHLEFDQGKRTLKLFRYPSFCWLMSRNNDSSSDILLSRLFEEKWSYGEDLPNRHYGVSPRAEDFFREVLLSYRLIFGQDKASWKAYRREAAKKPQDDPLLLLLCGQDWRTPSSRPIYDAIDAADDDVALKTYTATDFPFLGKRILYLQHFTKSQYPHNWRMLWHDMRDASKWWTIWAVLLIGGGTIILGVVTLAFQIMQAVYGARGNVVVYSVFMYWLRKWTDLGALALESNM